MKRFIISFFLFAVPILLFFFLRAAVIICWRAEDVKQVLTPEPGTCYLFLGDSHIGYSILPSRELHTHVLFQPGCHPLLSLFKLREMERLGLLNDISYCFMEIGYQTEASMNFCSLNAIFFSNFVYFWRYLPEMPVKVYLALDTCCQRNVLNSELNSSPSQTATSLTDRSALLIKKQIEDVVESHFGYLSKLSDDMLPDYAERIRYAVKEIHTICRRHHICLVIFSSPLTSFYRKAIPYAAKQHMAQWKRFFEEQEIPYLDMTASMPDSAFVESHHLLAAKRGEFTSLLLTELKNIPRLNP